MYVCACVCVGVCVCVSSSYRKVVSNNCTAGVIAEYTSRRQRCPVQAPRGLHLVTREGTLTATLAANVTFLVFLEEVSQSVVEQSRARTGRGWGSSSSGGGAG